MCIKLWQRRSGYKVKRLRGKKGKRRGEGRGGGRMRGEGREEGGGKEGEGYTQANRPLKRKSYSSSLLVILIL